jgi:hypothetical protein
MTYAEYLRSMGASEEEVKILDTAVGRKSYETMQSQLASASEAARKAKEGADNYHKEVDTWFENHDKEFKTIEQQLIAAKAKAASFETALRTINDRGIIDVTKELGLNLDAPANGGGGNGGGGNNNNRSDTPPNDGKKYITEETVLALAEREAESIALMSDIAAEHVYLFGQPLRNARELRKEATQKKVPLEQVWMEKYNVVKARADKDAAAKKADEDRIRKDEHDKVVAEFAAKYGDPNLRVPEPSRSFLVPRANTNREKQPWETGIDGEGGSNDRVKRATATALRTMTN